MSKLTASEIASGIGYSGGHDAFYNIFLILLDGVFGDETTCSTTTSKSWKKGNYGGWLKECFAVSGIEYSNSLSSSVSRGTMTDAEKSSMQKFFRLSMQAAYLVYILSPDRNIVAYLMRLRQEYELRVDMLPRKMQMRLLHQPEYDLLRSGLHQNYDNVLRLIDPPKQVSNIFSCI